MDHFKAVNNQAVEQYLLGQMPEAEIEEFEQHFFECGLCAEEVQSGIVFQENARAAFAAVPQPEPAPAKRNWFAAWWPKPAFAVPAFAAALLAVVVIYQAGFEIPALRQQIAQSRGPQALLAFALRPASRGTENRITIPAGTQSVVMQMDLTDGSFPSYRCDLDSQSGSASLSVDSPAPPAGSPLNLWIPVAKLTPGTHTLTVRGIRDSTPGSEVARYPFQLQIQ
jgi:hypothetical protein